MRNSRIKYRIYLIGIGAILGILVFAGILLWERRQVVEELSGLSEIAELGPAIGALVHELQKERGASTGFIDGGNAFGHILEKQREATGESLAPLLSAFDDFDAKAYGGSLIDGIETVRGGLARLAEVRDGIDTRSLSVAAAVNFYTSVNAALIGVIGEMAALNSDAAVANHVIAYTILLQAKENAGLERAMGSAGFGGGRFSLMTHHRFLQLIAEQAALMAVFNTHATNDQKAFLAAIVTGAAVDEVERLREIAIGSRERGSVGGVTGTQWFEAATARIDLLKIAEDRLGADLRMLAAAKLRAAQAAFDIIAIVTVVLLAAVLALSYFIIHGIVGPLTAMTEAMGRLARGDRSVEIGSRDRRDEIGEMATALDAFRANAIELAEARDMLASGNAELGEALEVLARHAEEHNRLLLESVGEGIYGLDLDGHVTFINPAAARMVGYAVEELVGQPIHDLIHHCRPDGSPIRRENCPMCMAIASGDVLRDQDEVLWRQDGTSFPVEYTRTPVLKDGAIAGAVVTFRDVTARKRAEDTVRKLSQAVEQSPVSVMITDTNGVIEYVNPKFTLATGYAAEEAIGRNPSMLKSGHTTPGDYKSLWRTIIAGKTWEGELRNQRKNGEGFWEMEWISPIKAEDGKITHFVAVKEDITARKQSEDALKDNQAQLNLRVAELEETHEQLEAQAARLSELSRELTQERDRAEAANNSKSEFLANMSHEIRTPMNGILGMTNLALGTTLSDEQRKFVETSRDSANALLAIINDILDFSKLEAGKLALEEIDFHFGLTLDNILSMLGVGARDKGLEIGAAVAPGLPQWLRADEGRLRQILVNLVGNAIKFTERGEIEIRVSHRELDAGRIELRCEVVDTGIGISDAVRDKLFDRFTQADGSVSRRFGGTGLGLSICKQLTELMGGEIGIESEEGKGSTFWFTVPCRPGEPPNEAERDHAAPWPGQVEPLRVLVAEDHPLNQMLVSTMLGRAGHYVDLASNGIEAVSAVKTAPYDLVLMDIQMPEMDGLTATREIRRLPGALAQIPIIALTANAMAGDRERYLAAGMSDYISKPIEPDAFFAAIARASCGRSPGETGSKEEAQPADPVPLFDEAVLGRLRGTLGSERVRERLRAVGSESERLLGDIQDALGRGDLEAAQGLARELQGKASDLAASRIAVIARRIEGEIRTIEAAGREATRLERAIEQTQAWVETAG